MCIARCHPVCCYVFALLGMVSLAGCGGSDSGTSPSPPPSKATVTQGCYSASYQGFGPTAIGCGILPSSGNIIFDTKLGQESSIQNSFWGLPTTVYLFDECPGQSNALSLPQKVILLGRNISVSTIISTGSDLPIAGILAHEWGHQAQFAFGWMNAQAPTQRATELEADAFSGYYMGLAKSWAGPQLTAYFQVLYSLGDYGFTDPGHHGTPNERVSAGALGLQVAGQSIQSRTQYSYAQLHSMFSSAIGAIVSKEQKDFSRETDYVVRQALEQVDIAFLREVAAGTKSAASIETPQAPSYVRESLFPYVSAAPR